MITLLPIEDIPTLMRWRCEVLRLVFDAEPSPLLLAENKRYYTAQIAAGLHFAVVALFEGREAGCGGVCFSDELPSPDNPTGRCAYLMNIYVRRPFRNHGVAHAIVKRLVEEARRRDCGKIYLETTEDGRPVYESIGFRDLPDMMKLYD